MSDEGVMRVLEEGAFERYVDSDGQRCPFCECEEEHSGVIEPRPGRILYQMECAQCGGEWCDVYVFAGINALGEGLEKVFPDSE